MSGAVALLGSPWRLDGPRLAWVAAVGMIAMILGNLVVLTIAANTPGLVSDFLAFWSFARFVHVHSPSGIYDHAGLHAFQIAIGITPDFPFLYPPGILLLLWPLGLCSYAVAFTLWIGIAFTIYLASLMHRRGWALVVLMVLAAPASAVCGALGQVGFLIAGLLIGGLRLAPSRPVLGGFLLGLAAVKPHLCLLVPIALAAAGMWRSLRAASATVFVLVLASSAAFGWTIWLTWAEAIPRLAQIVVDLPNMLLVMPTVTGNLRLLGAAPRFVALAQIVASGTAAWAIWRAFRNGPSRAASASLLAAPFLVTPYSLIGDLPVLTGAVVLLVQDRLLAGRTIRTAEIAVLGLAIWLPYLMICLAPFALSAAAIGLLLAVAVAWASSTPRPRGSLVQTG